MRTVGQWAIDFLMREDGPLCAQDSTALKFIFQFAQMAAIKSAHQLRLQEAFNRITRQVHCTTPADSR